MKIYIGSDHAGFELKKNIIDNYNTLNLFQDCGCFNKNSVDYPDIAKIVCDNINKDLNNNIYSIGILICGTGIGMSIAANKFKNIRCALVHNIYTSEMAKKHNNANVLTFGSRIINFNQTIDIINKFLDSEFDGGRHIERLNKLP